ncbi:hypothetical protein ScPMuIL_011395 [Solemya velum]
MEADLTCGVCWDIFDNPMILPCGHSFCRKCINATIYNQYTEFLQFGPNTKQFDCPVCQQKIVLPVGQGGADELTPNRALQSMSVLYLSKNPCHINDIPWNREIVYKDDICPAHQEKMFQFCQTCDVAFCDVCRKSGGPKHDKHIVIQTSEYASSIQTEIVAGLVEMKTKFAELEDTMGTIEDMMTGIDEAEKEAERHLEREMEDLFRKIRLKSEDLGHELHQEFELIRKPVLACRSRCDRTKKVMDDLKSKMFEIQQGRNTSLRIKLMKQVVRQLNSLQCFDVKNQAFKYLPDIDIPTWHLNKKTIEASFQDLKWNRSDQLKSNDNAKKSGLIVQLRGVDVHTQTDIPVLFEEEDASSKTSEGMRTKVAKESTRGKPEDANFFKYIRSTSGRYSSQSSVNDGLNMRRGSATSTSSIEGTSSVEGPGGTRRLRSRGTVDAGIAGGAGKMEGSAKRGGVPDSRWRGAENSKTGDDGIDGGSSRLDGSGTMKGFQDTGIMADDSATVVNIFHLDVSDASTNSSDLCGDVSSKMRDSTEVKQCSRSDMSKYSYVEKCTMNSSELNIPPKRSKIRSALQCSNN